MPESPQFNSATEDLIKNLLVKDPTKRLGADNIF
jgi:hypothetical protein